MERPKVSYGSSLLNVPWACTKKLPPNIPQMFGGNCQDANPVDDATVCMADLHNWQTNCILWKLGCPALESWNMANSL